MLTDFFFQLRQGGVPVSLKEFLTLHEALQKKVAWGSLDDFYLLSRVCLVKDESHYDRFDRVFGEYFRGIAALPDDLLAVIPAQWLRANAMLTLSDEDKKLIESLGGWPSRRSAMKAARSGLARAAPRRSAPTATTPRACASARRGRATAAR